MLIVVVVIWISLFCDCDLGVCCSAIACSYPFPRPYTPSLVALYQMDSANAYLAYTNDRLLILNRGVFVLLVNPAAASTTNGC